MRESLTRPLPITNQKNWKTGTQDAVLRTIFRYAEGKTILGADFNALTLMINTTLRWCLTEDTPSALDDKPNTLNDLNNDMQARLRTTYTDGYICICRAAYNDEDYGPWPLVIFAPGLQRAMVYTFGDKDNQVVAENTRELFRQALSRANLADRFPNLKISWTPCYYNRQQRWRYAYIALSVI